MVYLAVWVHYNSNADTPRPPHIHIDETTPLPGVQAAINVYEKAKGCYHPGPGDGGLIPQNREWLLRAWYEPTPGSP